MEDIRSNAIQYAHDNASRFLSELKQFASIPSISTDEASKANVQRAAEWIANHLRSLGMEHVQVFSTPGHPIVYGDWLKADPNSPTALIYGHYDVQPVDPIELWKSAPFSPDIRADNIYARGITDMKGQVLVALDAIEAILKTPPQSLRYQHRLPSGHPISRHFLRRIRKCLAVMSPSIPMQEGYLQKSPV